MKAKVLIVFLTSLALSSCNKDGFTTSPQLTFKSVNGTVFPNGGYIDFKFQATDKQGDIQDSIWMQRISYIPDCVGQDSTPIGFSMPQFTGSGNLTATIDLTFTNGTSDGFDGTISQCIAGAGSALTDSCYFKFWMKDDAGNVSDTVVSPTIVLLNM